MTRKDFIKLKGRKNELYKYMLVVNRCALICQIEIIYKSQCSTHMFSFNIFSILNIKYLLIIVIHDYHNGISGFSSIDKITEERKTENVLNKKKLRTSSNHRL